MIRALALRVLAVMVLLPIPALAGVDGTYVLEGGAYVIDVRFADGQLEVVEPNATTVYQQQADGAYLATIGNGQVYGLRVIDDETLEAFKPIPGNVPTRLKRQVLVEGGGLADDEFEKAEAIADHYFELSQSDPVNTQTWTQCAAAAMMKTMMAADQAHQGAVQAASLLKMITTNTAQSPCPDAISAEAWQQATSF
jgi:hypothetical protein